MRPSSWLTSIALALAVSGAAHAETKLNLSASAERTVENDTMLVVLSTENTAPDTSTLYGLTNEAITLVTGKAKPHSSIKIKPGSRSMSPIYSETKGEEAKIVGWRERAEVQLESKKFPDLYTLVGDVLSSQKTSLQVRNISFSLSDDAAKVVGDELYATALKNIKGKALLVSTELGKEEFRIDELTFNGPFTSGPRPLVMMRGKVEAMAAPAGLEAGESNVRVDVSGAFTPRDTPDF